MSYPKRFSERMPDLGSLITIIILIQLFSVVSFAQAQTTSILITVVDASQKPVSGVFVTIKKVDSTQSFTEKTNEEGQAKFTGIEPGSYEVSVKDKRESPQSARTVQVLAGQTNLLTIVLPTGIMKALQVETDVPEDQRVDELSALPNFNNDLTPILQVTVGAVPTGAGQLGRIIVDGRGRDTTTIRLDGIDASPQIDLPSADPSLDIIDSFQRPGVAFNIDSPGAVARAFAAQYGPGTGTVIDNATLRASEVWRAQFNVDHLNSAFNARNYFDYFGKNDIQRTRFGSKAGGPLGKGERSPLLYFAYEGLRGRTERTIFEAVPLEAVCRCGVNGLLGTLLHNYLPDGTVVLPNVSLNSGFLAAQRRGRISVEANSFDIRFDQTLSHKTALALRYIPQSSTNLVPDGITGRRQRQKISFNNFLASFVFTPKKSTNFFRFGFNNTRVQVSSENPVASSIQLTQAVVSLGGTVRTTGLPGLTTIPVATIGTLIRGVGRGFDLDPKTISLNYETIIDLEPKKHQLFIGVESRFVRFGFDRLGGINYSFSNLDAFRSGVPTNTNFLSDLSGASPFSDLTGKRQARQNYFLSYVQFRSKILDENLTLTYGLRYDYFSGVKESNNRVFLLDPESGAVLPPNSAFIRTEKNNFQPRFGLTYNLKHITSPKNPLSNKFFEDMVLSLGVGVYSGSPRIADLVLPIESDRLNTTINGGNFNIGINDVLQNFREQPLTRQFQPLVFSRNFRIPERLYKWDVSIKKPIKDMYDLIFLYTGNVGRSLPIARVGNQIISVSTNPNPTLPAIVVRQFDILGNNGQVLKPYGEFFYRTSEGSSNYNAATIQFKTNTSTATTNLPPRWLRLKSLSILYTYSFNKGNASGTVVSNPFDIDADYGFNAVDVRHNFSFSAIYHVWESVGKPGKPTSLLRGWRLIPLLSVRSGFPLVVKIDRPEVVYVDGSGNVFSAPAAGRTAVLNVRGGGASAGSQVPSILPNVNPYSSNGGLTWLNPQAFTIPQPGNFGNLRRGQLRGPGSISLDLGVSRYLVNNDRYVAETRVDFFNIFNRANFVNPTASLPNALGTSVENNQIQPEVPFSSLSAGSFGIITAAELGRRVQFSLIFRLKKGFTN